MGKPSSDQARRLFAPLIPDLETRAAQFETDIDVVDDELIALLAVEIDTACTGLSAAIPTGDVDTIREYAHTLQGMGGAASVPEISVVGEEFSSAARAGDFQRCTLLMQALVEWRNSWR